MDRRFGRVWWFRHPAHYGGDRTRHGSGWICCFYRAGVGLPGCCLAVKRKLRRRFFDARLLDHQVWIFQRLIVLRAGGLVERPVVGWNIYHRANKPEVFVI